MKPGVYFFFFALSIAATLFCSLIQFNPSGILSLVLEYPAQGEEEAARNLWKVIFLVLPCLQLLGGSLAILVLPIIDKFSMKIAYVKAVTLALMIGAFLVLTVKADMTDQSDWKSILFHTLVLSGYLGAFMVLGKLGKGLLPPVARGS